ncbi:acyltransferase domain-containing protein [Gammaproteobacteria bacterium]|nr:acyltransferase domain-containing protein [Gammaproteobacteria bacterium]
MKHALCLIKSPSKTALNKKLVQAKIDLLNQKAQYPTYIDNQTLKAPHYVFAQVFDPDELTNWQPDHEPSIVEINKTRPITGLFTGQGAQFFNMGKSHYEHIPVFKQQMDLCAKILEPLLGLNILACMFEEQYAPQLNQTKITQPVLFAFEYAMAQVLKHWGIHFDLVIGHSVGEFAAATIAGMIELEDGLKLIAKRAELMQSLPSGGTMAAVMTDYQTMTDWISSLDYTQQIDIAGINAPSQTVISGEQLAISELITYAKSQQVKAVKLDVSHAFHSMLMDPILNTYQNFANQVEYRPPTDTQVISNVTGQVLTSLDGHYWKEHIRQPVNFCKGIEHAAKLGSETFIELGPQPILSQLGKKTLTEPNFNWLPTSKRKAAGIEDLFESVKKLSTSTFQ